MKLNTLQTTVDFLFNSAELQVILILIKYNLTLPVFNKPAICSKQQVHFHLVKPDV